ncbi:MAG: hypothetical protein Q9172_003052 [Xanthocarpia lactea]
MASVSIALSLLSSLFLVNGAPNVSPGRQLFPRANPCERSGTPILYKDYGPDVCPGKYQLNPDGKTCPMNLVDNCEVFCQLKDRFFYDMEQPAWLHGQGGSHCYGPMTCTITESETWTWTYTGSGTVSGTIAKSGTSIGLTFHSGIATLGEPAENATTKGCGYDVTEDHCATRPSYVPDFSSIKGATVFVRIDCSNNQRLPMDQQNPAYNHPGVAAPQNVFDTWIADLPVQEPEVPEEEAPATPPKCECGESSCTPESPPCCANGSCKLDGTCSTPNCD